MAKYHYYGVKDDYAWCLPSNSSPLQVRWWQPKLFRESDLVWCQGPQGGVRFISQRWSADSGFVGARKHGYITNDPESMQEFAWVKLKARMLSIGS